MMATLTSSFHAGGVPSPPHHNRDLSLQKYCLLQEQHDSLCQHLEELRPMYSALPHSTGHSPVASPCRGSVSSASTSVASPPPQRQHKRRHQRRSSLPSNQMPKTSFVCTLEPVPDESAMMAAVEEEARLFAINEGIKRALTELLNCETVRHDCRFRTWVQCRLMEVERELRSERRTKRSP